MRKILMVNYEFPPIGGGAGNACYYMLKEYSGYKDLQIDLVTFSGENENSVEQFSENIRIFKVLAGKKKNLHDWKFTEMLRWIFASTWFSMKLIKKEGTYDLLHCWSGWPSGFTGLACGIRFRIPYIVALRGSDIPGYNNRPMLKFLEKSGLKLIYRLIWKRAKAVTVLSEDSREMARKLITNIDYKLIRNGINTEEFYPSKDHKFDSENIRFLYVGRLVERKGVLLLLSAVRKILETHPYLKFSLKMVGDGALADVCEQYVSQHELETHVELTGRVEHEELPKIYHTADVFVLPSITEALGNVTQEAIAAGLPIITTDTGAGELVEGNGIVLPVDDEEALYQAMLDVLLGTIDLAKMRDKSIELSKDMGWDTTSKLYYDLYQTTISLGR